MADSWAMSQISKAKNFHWNLCTDPIPRLSVQSAFVRMVIREPCMK